LQNLCGQISQISVGSVLFQPKLLWVSLLKKSDDKGKRVKIPHGRATVIAIWDLGLRIWDWSFERAKSRIANFKIPNRTSLETCPKVF